jgi:hypothetical protein
MRAYTIHRHAPRSASPVSASPLDQESRARSIRHAAPRSTGTTNPASALGPALAQAPARVSAPAQASARVSAVRLSAPGLLPVPAPFPTTPVSLATHALIGLLERRIR